MNIRERTHTDMEHTKIYARTVEPELQDGSQFLPFMGEYVITGNRDFGGINADLCKHAMDDCDDLAYGYEIAWLTDSKGKAFTKEAMETLRKIAMQDGKSWGDVEEEYFLAYLGFYFGIPYVKRTIRGCSQGDWNYLYCPKAYDDEFVGYLEACYFNTGTELVVFIDDERSEPLDAHDINGCSFYTEECTEEGIKAHLVKTYGVSPEDVVLYVFDGYEQKAKYRRAE